MVQSKMTCLRRCFGGIAVIGLTFVWLQMADRAAAEQGLQLESLAVHPTHFQFDDPRQRLQLVVTGHLTDGSVVDLTGESEFRAEPANHIEVHEQGRIRPLHNGKVDLRVHAAGMTLPVSLEISGQKAVSPVSFDYQVLPILAKSGCSTGSCHGSPNGKGGFRLSLLAFDRDLDRRTLIREDLGRRTNPLDPEQSLLLSKPTMRVAHEGGKRLSRHDEHFQALRDWIGEGCRVNDDEPECLGIAVYPADARLLHYPSWNQQFSVLARFADGSVKDITSLAVFMSSDENVVKVAPNGLAQGQRRGEAAVVVRYLSFIETCLLTFVREVEGFVWSDPTPANYIDAAIYAKLRQLQYLPSAPCSDEEFVRRVYLDVVGVLPTMAQASGFLNNPTPNRREELINQLLDRPDYAKFWGQKWGDLLRVSRKQIGLPSVFKYSRWLEQSIAYNQPYDDFVRELLTANGSTLTQPAANYYRTAGDTLDAMETTAQVFLGARIQCAKCHNHPFEKWTQNDYYGLAANFNRVQRRNGKRPGEFFIWSDNTGEINHPRTGKPVAPRVPDPDQLTADEDRIAAFAEWLTAPENRWFAKVEVNRIWAQIMGRGIVEPFDDFRESNPPANAELLDALAEDFVRRGFDRKHVLRTILNSHTYQASSRALPFNVDDTKYFSHYYPRLLTAEQLVDALGRITDHPKQFAAVPVGTRATQLPAPDLQPEQRSEIGNIDFLKVFGQPERQTICECERGDDPSLGQALQLYNGKFIHGMLSDPKNRIHRQVAQDTSASDIIEELYWLALSRPPSEAELQINRQYWVSHEDRAKALEDIYWAVINKHEFLFQH